MRLRLPSPTFVARLAICLAATLAPAPARAEVRIKLGTLAPKGSIIETLLKQMGQEWEKASGGQVKLTVFGGGVVGNEGEMVRRMRVGGIQAAALTSVGLHDITPEPQAIGVPMGIGSYDELAYVLGKMEPSLNKAIEAQGYVVLTWATVGFVSFFSTRRIAKVADVKEAKLFAWDGDPKSVEAWKAGGFNPVVLSSTDIIPSLQTGMIDTVATAPLYALTARIYKKANRLSTLKWALLNGATVVKKDEWEKVDPAVRPKLIQIAREFGKKIDDLVRTQNDDAIEQMKKDGLEVVPYEDLKGWEDASVAANKVVRGGVVPAPVYDEVIKHRDDYRKQHSGKP